MLGRRVHIAFGRVHHNNAAAGGGIDIDIVHANTGPADNLQRRGRVDEVRRDFGGTAHHQSSIRWQQLAQGIGSKSGLDRDINRIVFLQDVNTTGRNLICNENTGFVRHSLGVWCKDL